jgi:hypothetical protein
LLETSFALKAVLVGNSDNRANSAQFQVKLPTGAELGKIPILSTIIEI